MRSILDPIKTAKRLLRQNREEKARKVVERHETEKKWNRLGHYEAEKSLLEIIREPKVVSSK
jgi:hypothetical protein